MKAFMTGATGFIGRVVLEKLIARGHEVRALVRTDPAASKVRAAGAEAVPGDLTDPKAVAIAADAADGFLHLGVVSGSVAFDPDAAFVADDRLLECLIDRYRGSGRALITTSGGSAIAILTPGFSHPVIHSEETPFVAPDFIRARVDMENATMAALSHGIRGIAIRPPHVYGRQAAMRWR